MGAEINKPSNRSKTPPCPGRIFPESLMLMLLLNMDSTKSPNVPKQEMITAMANQCCKA